MRGHRPRSPACVNSFPHPASPAPSRRFEILEHTADVGVRAFGADPAEVFQSAVRGLFSILFEPADLEPTDEREVSLSAANYSELLCDFLNHLLYLFDTEKLIPVFLVVIQLEPTQMCARISFTAFDANQHAIRTYIKAVTYHQLKFESHDTGAVAEFYLDV